jgi:hypothetical protein
MGHVIVNGLDLMSTAKTTRLDPGLKAAMSLMRRTADKASLTARERLHVKALELWSDG